MRLRFFIPALAALAAGAIHTPDARACGGCFHPPIIQQGESTVVTGHRMAFATSPTQTVLWDQIAYSGDPKEFAWVLPVRPGATVEQSTDAWFEALEAATAVQVTSPVIHCPEIERPRRSGGCASQSEAGADFGGGGGPGSTVTVVHQGTVGPYETVTLSTQTPGALNGWLTDHGFNVDADIQPVIDGYVKEGFDFIALRLLPDKGVREMKPVRVVTPGAGVTLPLRMVAAGTGANVAITLYTITESRQQIEQYTNTTVPESLLLWDFAAQSSNYAEARKAVLAQNGGRTWITSFAHDGGLLSPLPGGSYVEGYDDYGQYYSYSRTIADIYLNQGLLNDETTDQACRDVFQNESESTSLVVDPCPAGVAPDDPSCGAVAAGQIDARTLGCGPLDDVKVALTGMHPRDVWVTRVEADLPRAALAGDLTIGPADEQQPRSNYLQAPVGVNADDSLCPTSVPPLSMIAPGYGKASGSGRRVDRTAMMGYAVMGALILGAIARRRRRR